MNNANIPPSRPANPSDGVIALVAFTNDRFLVEWSWLLINRIRKTGNRYHARISSGQGVPNVTPGATEVWGRFLKGDNQHLRLPTLTDGESAEMTVNHLKHSPTQAGSA